MMGLETMQAMNDEAVARAKKGKLTPYIAIADNDEGVFRCPKLGDYIPKGWNVVGEYFVDSSGFGAEGEPALTVRQFVGKVKAGLGYAISDEGQFQVYVREFEKIKGGE